jgi:hypothetical protein
MFSTQAGRNLSSTPARPRACPLTACWKARSADRVDVYNGAVRFPMTGYSPQDYAENMARMKAAPERFTLI